MGIRIVADELIFGAREVFSSEGVDSLVALPSDALNRNALDDADALIVRSRTRVDADLLEGTPVRFVATATSGTEHVDQAYLENAGVAFADAGGSNARSVAEFTLASLEVTLPGITSNPGDRVMAVVGVGHVGTLVAQGARKMGFEVLMHDPPREDAGHPGPWHALNDVLEADVISLHVPLSTTGPHATHHLVDAEFLGAMKTGAFLLNTSRGAVVDSRALQNSLESQAIAGAALDVHEGEPDIDRDLLHLLAVATPHVAGRSLEGMLSNTVAVHEKLCRHFGIEHEVNSESPWETPQPTPVGDFSAETIEKLWRVSEYGLELRKSTSIPSTFQRLRDRKPLRHDLLAYGIDLLGT